MSNHVSQPIALRMKALALAVILLASTAWAGEDVPIPTELRRGMINMATDKDDPIYTNIEITKPENRAILIKQWAASGEVCRVLGHRWDEGWLIDGAFVIRFRGDWTTTFRKCSICGKVETKEEVWR